MSGRYVSPYGQCVSALTQVDLYNEGRGLEERRRKGKEEYLYNAILYTMYISKQSDMDHTVLPANTPCLPWRGLVWYCSQEVPRVRLLGFT